MKPDQKGAGLENLKEALRLLVWYREGWQVRQVGAKGRRTHVIDWVGSDRTQLAETLKASFPGSARHKVVTQFPKITGCSQSRTLRIPEDADEK